MDQPELDFTASMTPDGSFVKTDFEHFRPLPSGIDVGKKAVLTAAEYAQGCCDGRIRFIAGNLILSQAALRILRQKKENNA